MRMGRSYYLHTGSSMFPTLRGRDLLLCGNSEKTRAGQVLVYASFRTVVAHRAVCTIRDGLLITRGDAHLRNDRRPVRPEDVLGVVTAVMRNGQIIPLRPANPELIRLRLLAKKGWAKLKTFLGLNSRRPRGNVARRRGR